MSKRIDQFFKDALSEHKVSPSAEAWNKVRAGQTKKNKLIIVWRMAAVLLLMGAPMGTWYFINSESELNAPAMLTEEKKILTPEKETISEPIESAREIPQPNLAQTTKPGNQKNKNNYREENQEDKNSITETITIDHRELADYKQEEIMISTDPILIAQTAETEKPIVIEFTLAPIVNEPVTEVTQNDSESASGLKKILETARDVKNGEADLGIIRDTKNQLLAFDFKKDKTKRN